jgi:nucleotide-binding universal stress UspA family protein
MASQPSHSGIIVGVDGSPASRAVVNWADRNAPLRNVPRTLLHMLGTPMVTWMATPIPAGFQDWQEQLA